MIRTRTCAYQGVRNVRFFRNFGALCFLEAPVLRLVLLPYHRRYCIIMKAYYVNIEMLVQSLTKKSKEKVQVKQKNQWMECCVFLFVYFIYRGRNPNPVKHPSDVPEVLHIFWKINSKDLAQRRIQNAVKNPKQNFLRK